MPANVDGMVREGVSAYRAGRKDEARALLMRAVEIDQYNEQAWLWLSAVVESVDEQRTCLENVLTINPNNERAKQGLDMLNQKVNPLPKSSSTAASEEILASTNFTAPPPPKTNPFSSDNVEELPSTIEWDSSPVTASSSASSNHRVNEPSEQEYDDWVSNLNLGGSAANKQTALPADAEKLLSMTGEDDEDDEIFDFNSALGLSEDSADDPFAGPFSAPATPLPTQQPSPAARTPLPRAATPSPRNKEVASDPLLDEIEDEVAEDSAFVSDFDDVELEKLEASEFFRYIPKEISATRLPGTRERYPILVMLGFVVMVALNIGAVVFLVMRMTSG